ncbi:Mesoderm induction early response protein 2, partial [Ophiophagus hannah]
MEEGVTFYGQGSTTEIWSIELEMASVGRQSPRIVPYPAHNLCSGRSNLHTTAVANGCLFFPLPAPHPAKTHAVVSMGSADHRFNLAEILSQNYGVQEKAEEADEEPDHAEEKAKPLEEIEKSFNAAQNSEMPFEELLALYGYEASDAISEQESQSNDTTPNLPDMTLDKEQIAKDLLSGEEEEETQSSADDLTPSEIMVGPQYQAVVPLLHLNRQGEKVYENDDQLLWDPNILPEREVEEFLFRAIKRRWDEVSNARLPEGEMVKDNEQALYELVKCNFNAEEALRRLRFNVKVIRDELCAWSEEECRNFEHGFRVHGKNFHLIQANKKSERYDYFTQQTRFGRKKDYVDNFLDGGEVENASRARSSPPIASATGCLDSCFNPDHLTMETAGTLFLHDCTSSSEPVNRGG